MIRYEVDSCKRAGPRELRLLERSFGRAAAEWSDRVTRAVVSAPSGYLFVAMDFIGPPEDARRECEHLYAIAWYDAFGVWGSTHVGQLVEETSPPEAPVGVVAGGLKFSAQMPMGASAQG